MIMIDTIFFENLIILQNGDILLKLLPTEYRNAVEIDMDKPTATCAVVFDRMGDSKLLLASMNIHQEITSEMVIYTSYEIHDSILKCIIWLAIILWYSPKSYYTYLLYCSFSAGFEK